jgi:branched-chain amino acid transport system substrate-binding protein
MRRTGEDGVRHDIEGSGYGFGTLRRMSSEKVEMPHHCQMNRPEIVP